MIFKSKSKLLIEIIFYSLLLISPGVSIAQQQNQLNLALGMMNFDYAEYEDGTFLDGEKGNIPGISLEFSKLTQSGMQASFGFDYFDGTIKYDGHLQEDLDNPNTSMLPYKGDSDATVTGLHASILKSITTLPELSIYGKLSYKIWDRYIHGRDHYTGTGNLGVPFDIQVGDTSEKYTWFQIGFGGQYSMQINEISNVNFYLGIFQTVNPQMEIKNLGLTFDQQEKTGYEAGFRWLRDMSPGKKLGISGSLVYWEFGRSNIIYTAVDTPGGVKIYSNWEPYSESTMTTIQIIYQQDLLRNL